MPVPEVAFCSSTSDFDGIRAALSEHGLRVIRYAQPRPAAWGATAAIILKAEGGSLKTAELCRELRLHAKTRGRPIILILPAADAEGILLGFAAGADDCLSLPLDARILAAHVAATVRRYADAPQQERLVRAGPLTIDLERYAVSLGSRAVKVTPSEFLVLELLVRRPGSIVRRAEILRALTNGGFDRVSHNIDTHLSNLRKKLGPKGRTLVETVSGVGYRLNI